MRAFIIANRQRIENRARKLLRALPVPRTSAREVDDGIPIVIDQLLDALQRGDRASEEEIEKVAAEYGRRLFARGFTVGELVHVYGTLCESVTKVGEELNARFSNGEFEMLNRVLDVAIAGAVTGHQQQRTDANADEEVLHLGSLAHELRNTLTSAAMSFSVIKKGIVGTEGRTSAALERSLRRMSDLLDRALAEVRLRKDADPIMQPMRVAEIFDDIAATAYPDAERRNQSLEIEVDRDLEIATDRQFLTSVISNLVQNGLKYTHRGGRVRIRARNLGDRFRVEVEDECGGLPPGSAEELFAPFVRGTIQSSGVGLGLSIVARGSRALGGDVHVQNLPGKGCIFTIDLPVPPVAKAAA